MKLRLLVLLAVFCCTASNVFGYDFQADDLYYNITSDSTVEVTYQVQPSPSSKAPSYLRLTSAVIPESVIYKSKTYSITSIGEQAFYRCTDLTSITIGNSVTTIGEYAFCCTGLTSVSIPSSVTSIGESAFRGCTDLTSVSIPSSVTSIGGYAFSLCTGLTSITIPNSVTTIEHGAFWDCTGLTSITIPNSVTSIGGYAFYGCTGLTFVTIPNSVTTIERFAFSNCTRLTSLNIPNSVTTIEDDAFKYVANIVYSGTATGAPWGARSVNGYIEGYFIYADATKTTLLGCRSAAIEAIGTITIPNSVTTIGDAAFYNCTGLTSITIPNSVTSIGDEAFYGCTALTSITIPNSITNIGDAAFCNCTGLTSITIPNSVTAIGGSAFYRTPWYDNQPSGVVYINRVLYKYKGRMSQGTSIVVKEGTTCISGMAFSQYPTLTSITIPNSVTSIGGYAFYGCTGLTSITIPNSVTTIGGRAFEGCTGLTSVTIGNDVTSIGGYAFYGCTGLTSITIPNSVTTIGDWAFSRCTGLKSVTCYAVEPPTVGYSLGHEAESIPLYVPEKSVEKYKAAEVWKHFKEILPIQNTAIDQPTLNPTGNSTQSRKVFRDGQVYIICGDKTYTVEGRQL